MIDATRVLNEELAAEEAERTAESLLLVDDDIVHNTPAPEVQKIEPVTLRPQNVEFDSSEDVEAKLLTDDPIITLPPRREEEMSKILNDLPNLPLADSGPGKVWAALVTDSADKATFDGMFDDTLRREGSEWGNGTEYKGAQLKSGYARYDSVGTELSGSRAVIRMLHHLGMGGIYSQALWHSGFWVSFKPATESEIVDLNHLLASDKISFGRYTYGLAFSNLTAYTSERLLQFANDHIYETSIRPEDLGNESVLSFMKSQDIPLFLLGFMASMYPRGFNYRRPCCNNPHKCNHVHEATLNLRILDRLDRSQLTQTQRAHMSTRRRGGMTLESIKRYQEEMSRLHPSVHTIEQSYGNTMEVTIGSPNVPEYIDAGHRWIDAMTEMVDTVIGKEAGSVERNSLVQKHGLASILCQFSHWVKEITFGGNRITDRETLDMVLTHLSSDDEVRTKLVDIIKGYISDSTVAVVGMKTFECPACHTAQGSADGTTTLQREVIPLDVIQVFMHLVRQRIARLARR